jgi:hypothetical protein
MPAGPGPDEGLLDRVLSFGVVAGHRIELPDQTMKGVGLEDGKFFAVHVISGLLQLRAAPDVLRSL